MAASPPEQFGEVLRRMREAAGHTQESLAELTGLSARGISDIERGVRTTPRLDTVRLIADGLGLGDVQRNYLFAVRNATNTSPTTFVRQRAADLPTPVNSFVGRARAIDSIIALLRAKDVRLLTLTGPGGVGKTRISIEVAHQVQHEFAHGAVFVDLSPLQNPAMVLPAVATRLGVIEQPGTDLKSVLQVALQDREMMLVLDNLEQVIGAAPDIAWLLATCPKLTVLATSRIVLRIAAEHIYEIEPMDLITTEPQHQSDAVSLFIQRATAANNQFTVNEDNAELVRELVARLQGMPLAIELAAARVRLWSISELLTMVNTQFLLSGTGSIDSPERHRSMRHTIAWSYDLLSSQEQAIFRALAIFPLGCTMDAAISILCVNDRFEPSQVIEGIENLVRSSLVRAREGVDHQIRYRMLYAVREFGLERLDAAAESSATRRAAHHMWVVPLALRAELVTLQPDIVQLLRHLDAENQNLVEHIQWLIDHEESLEALRLYGLLSFYGWIRGPNELARRDMEKLLDDPKAQAPSLERLQGLMGLAWDYDSGDDLKQARVYMLAAKDLARKIGEVDYLPRIIASLAQNYAFSGDLAEAESCLEELHTVDFRKGEYWIFALESHLRSYLAQQYGDMETSLHLLNQAVAISHEHGVVFLESRAQADLGYQLLLRNRFDEAEQSMLAAVQRFQDLGDLQALPVSYTDLSDIARLRGDTQTAREWAERAYTSAREIGSMRGIALASEALARIDLLDGDPKSAEAHIRSAMYWLERCDMLVYAVNCLDVYAEVALASGSALRAAWCLGAVDGVLESRGGTRPGRFNDEDAERKRHVKLALGSDQWIAAYDAGTQLTIAEILEEVNTWTTARPIA